MMLTNDQLRDYLAGKLSPRATEEIDRQVTECVTLQARCASLSVDPIVDRLRKVWHSQQLAIHAESHGDNSSEGRLVLVDRYWLIERIGTGGMGQVWKAKPVHSGAALVALKLVKPGLDSKSIFERFELERKALAMMDHPGIAKVLDGGSTDQGQSYFVMELVDGPSVTEYCHQHQLDIDQRVRLFVQVCRAVQHAHQKGIIHRDLKPSNILVTQCDGQPLPKVIDFGLAKAFGDVTNEHSQLTEFGALIGTVRYMSPEQAGLHSWDIDTRSDIYSLGVVLYELLTGTSPIGWPSDGEQSLLHMLQSIRETDPPKPSERLKASLAALSASASLAEASDDNLKSAAAGQRSSSCRAFREILRRDLDWIVMKAIEKSRERRYQTLDSFVQDIERYLTGQPVSARPPSTIYRLRKFVNKNRGAVWLAVAVLVMAMLGVASLLWSAQADSERRAVYAAASYSSIINELNSTSVSRRSGWTHRGLQLIQQANMISTPLRDSRQLRDWAAILLTTPDVNMTECKRYAAELSPTDMTYSPSGRLIAVGLATTDALPQTTLILIDLETGEQRQLVPDTTSVVVEKDSDPGVTSLRFGQDDETLYVGTRNGLLLRVQLGKSPPAVTCVRASRGGVLVRLSKDGRYCVTVTSRQQKQAGPRDERMRCFDAMSLQQLAVSETNQRAKHLSIAPDGSRVAVTFENPSAYPDESVEYELPQLAQLRTIPGENAEYHPLGHAVFTGDRATHKRFSLEKLLDATTYLTGTTLAWTPSSVPTFQEFQLAKNGAMLAASSQADRCIFFWREAESIPSMVFRLPHNEKILGYSLSPELDSMAVITNADLQVFNFTNRRQYRDIFTLHASPEFLAVAPDQTELTTKADHVLFQFQLPTLRPIDSIPAVFSSIARATIAYDSTSRKLASTRVVDDHDTEIVISDKARMTPDQILRISSEPEKRFSAHKVAGLGWIDNVHLIAAIDFRLMVWNTTNGRLEVVMPQQNPTKRLSRYWAIAVKRHQCVTLTEEGKLDHWHWTGSELATRQPSIELNTSQIERIAWHPSGDCVVVGMQNGWVQSIDLRHRQNLCIDRAIHSGEICGATWCDAHRLVTASRDGLLAIWQNSNGVLTPYVAWNLRSGITALDVSSDGQRCYVASAGESISIIDLAALDAEFARLGIDGRGGR